jgi:hypothetical protein
MLPDDIKWFPCVALSAALIWLILGVWASPEPPEERVCTTYVDGNGVHRRAWLTSDEFQLRRAGNGWTSLC